MEENIKKLVEDTLGFKLGVTCTNEPITIEDLTIVNGLIKKEGEPVSQMAYSKNHARKMLVENLPKLHLSKGHCAWGVEPHYDGTNIRFRISRW